MSERDNVVHGAAVTQSARAACVVADHLPNRAPAVRGRIGAEPKTARRRGALQVVQNDTGLHDSCRRRGIDIVNSVQVTGEIQHDAGAHRIAGNRVPAPLGVKGTCSARLTSAMASISSTWRGNTTTEGRTRYSDASVEYSAQRRADPSTSVTPACRSAPMTSCLDRACHCAIVVHLLDSQGQSVRWSRAPSTWRSFTKHAKSVTLASVSMSTTWTAGATSVVASAASRIHCDAEVLLRSLRPGGDGRSAARITACCATTTPCTTSTSGTLSRCRASLISGKCWKATTGHSWRRRERCRPRPCWRRTTTDRSRIRRCIPCRFTPTSTRQSTTMCAVAPRRRFGPGPSRNWKSGSARWPTSASTNCFPAGAFDLTQDYGGIVAASVVCELARFTCRSRPRGAGHRATPAAWPSREAAWRWPTPGPAISST